MTIDDLKIQEREAYDKLFADCGVFFAFSDEQFLENKTPLTEGEKYTSIGHGGYMPKSKVNAYIQGSKDIRKGFASKIKESKELRYAHIRYELANHEAQYTGELDDTMEALGPEYTREEVYVEYKYMAAQAV